MLRVQRVPLTSFYAISSNVAREAQNSATRPTGWVIAARSGMLHR